MNPDVKKKWIDALRSGEYKQGHGWLKDKNNNYCCLGVLCEVQGIPNYKVPTYNYEEHYEFDFNKPGETFIRFRKSKTPVEQFLNSVGFPFDESVSKLTTMNDFGRNSFSEIADYIEEHF